MRTCRVTPVAVAILLVISGLIAPESVAQTVSETGGSRTQVLGAPEVVPGLGLAVVDLPVEVPPGRHGMQPMVALRYSSGAGPGNAGLGFGYDPGSIRRSRRFGPPRFDNGDTFTLSLGGESLDLVPLDSESTHFRTSIDTGYMIDRLSPGPLGPGSSYWVARGRDGRSYRFGFNADTEAGNISQSGDLIWGLDMVEDTSGNVMEVTYRSAALRIYPTRIEYASHPATGLQGTNAVEFCWEGRGDTAPTLWGERLVYRLATITTRTMSRTVRSYRFEYDMPADANRIGVCPIPRLPEQPAGHNGDTNGRGYPRSGVGTRIFPQVKDSGSIEASASTTTSTDLTTSLPTNDSHLVRVRRADGEGNELPAIDYSYRIGPPVGWSEPVPDAALPVPFIHVLPDKDIDSGVRIVDVNRDGLPDLVQLAGVLTGSITTVTNSVHLNTGHGFVYDPVWSESLLNLVDETDQSRSAYITLKIGRSNPIDNGVRFLDVNDDGYQDIVRMAHYFSLGFRMSVHLNTGRGFTRDASEANPLPVEPFVLLHEYDERLYSDDYGVRIVDVNADGRADLIRSRAHGGSASRIVYLYDRGSYRHAPDWVLPDEPFVRRLSNGFWVDMGVRLMELNGDGYIDIFKASIVDGVMQNVAYLHSRVPGGPAPTWIRSDDDWFLSVTGDAFVMVITSGAVAAYDRGLRVADINADGLSDIVAARSWDSEPTRKMLFSPRREGGWKYRVLSKFPGVFIVKQPGGIPRDQGVRLADIDGDGAVDYVASSDPGEKEWRPGHAWLGRSLMTSYSNGIGGMTSIRYAPAPHTGTADGNRPAALPFALAVVDKLTAADGMGNEYTTRYSYDGGFYQHRGRDFRGFRTVTSIEPGDERMITTRYYQQTGLPSSPLKGIPQEQTVRRSSDGAVFTLRTWEYDTADELPPLNHPLLRTETSRFDWSVTDPEGGTPVTHSGTSFLYVFDETVIPDRPLIRRVEWQDGEVDDPEDDRFIDQEFCFALDPEAAFGPDSGRWFLEMPCHRTVAGVDGTIVSESWIYYDDRPAGEVGQRGLPTREVARGGVDGAAGAVAPEDPGNPSTSRTYDIYGNVTSETDPLGRVTTIEHGVEDGSFTFPEREIDPFGHITQRRFDPATGLVVWVVDPNGHEAHVLYDGFGRRIAEYGPYDTVERPTVSFRHDYTAVPSRVFRYVRERSGQGETTGTDGTIESIACFDGLGRLLETRTEAPGGATIVTGAVTFDAAGRISLEAEPFFAPSGSGYIPPSDASHFTRREYDAADRLTAVTNAAGETRRENHYGRTSILVDPSGHRRDIRRDAFGIVVEVVEYEGVEGTWIPSSTATYRHDAAGRLTRVTAPSGAVTMLSYDTGGRRIGLDDPHVGSWRYRYDLSGNLVEEIDPAGRRMVMAYDALDRLTEKTAEDGTVFRWYYDEGGDSANALGRLTSIVDPTGTQWLTHDALGRVIRTSRLLDGVAYTVLTGYDALSRVTSVDLPGGGSVRYEYDSGGNLSAALPFATSLSYDERGQLTRTLLQNGLLIERSYEQTTGRPERLIARAATGEILLHFTYDFFSDGQIERLNDWAEPSDPQSDIFSYDGRHRLVRSEGAHGLRDYLYDDAGNLLVRNGSGHFYDDPGRPQWITRTSDGRAFSYDTMGNITRIRSEGSDRNMTYDAFGRLVEIADPLAPLVVTNAYDAGGNRIRELTVRSDTRSVLLTPMPQIEIRDGMMTLHHFAGDLRIATVDPERGTLYPVIDHLGSTRLIVDRDGRTLARYDYSAYGERVGPSAGDEPLVSHMFASAIRHEDTGLQLMGARYYDASLGRFIQPDSLVSDRFDPHALNRYAYARDNPVNITDPSGRSPLTAFLLLGAVALLDKNTRTDVARSVALTAVTILLTGTLGPGPSIGLGALAASTPALYAATVTPVILNSRLGHAILMSYAMLFQDLGLSRRNSAAAAHLLSTFLLNSHLQRSFGATLASNGEARAGRFIGDRPMLDGHLAGRGLTPGDLRVPSGDGYGTQVPEVVGAQPGSTELDRFFTLVDASGRSIGVFGVRDMGLGFNHGAVGFFPSPTDSFPAIVRRAHYAYSVGGISTQQFARELFGAGYSGSLFTLTGRASDFLLEFVYGPYGGGLVLGVSGVLSVDDGSGRAP